MMRVAVLVGPGGPRIETALPSSRGLEQVEIVPIHPATETQLRKLLAEQPCAVVVLAVELAVSGAAYATATLADSQGQARKVNVQVLGQLLAQAGVRVVVLPGGATSQVTKPVAETLVAKGVSAVATLPLLGTSCARLLAALARGETVSFALVQNLGGVPQIVNYPVCGDGDLRIAAGAADHEPMAARPAAAPAPTEADLAPTILRSKRESNRFDVFLCHNSADKPSVKRIGARLKAQGILPWLDEWELPPGQPWQALLEQQITRIGSAAVFIGASGISPWHQQEMRGFLSEFADRQVPVIPVLLPDAPAQPELPLFLRQMTWVDFRTADPDPLERLVWGITGQRPEQGRSL